MGKKYSNKDVCIIIPAYNEEKVIKEVLESVKKEGYTNILVVCDGSSDKTAEVATNSGVEVLEHVMNRGQGAALRTGIEYLEETYKPKVIITFDADGQHNPKDIEKIAKPVLENEVDVVLGSRFLEKQSKIPLTRKTILKLGVIFTRLISNLPVTDTHNGFRALGKKAIKSIKITHRGMEHASEIIDEIKKKRLSFKEIPIEIKYTDYSKIKGQKSSNFMKIGIKMVIKKIL